MPEDLAPSTAFIAPVDEVGEVSLAALDTILAGLPPAGSGAEDKELRFDDDPPSRPRRSRGASKRRAARGSGGADGSPTGTPLQALSRASRRPAPTTVTSATRR
jgi:hypothetical protein